MLNPISLARRAKRRAVHELRRRKTPAALAGATKLHLGCGDRILPGWANIDIDGRGTLVWDLLDPLPIPPSSIAFVYSEHFIEHISRDDALRLLRHVRRIIRPGGVVRVSTPDLRHLAEDYLAGRLTKDLLGWSPPTLCRMVNEGMRLWGHIFLYDEPEIVDLFHEAGFRTVRRVEDGASERAELRGLESRPIGGNLIVEAIP